MKTTLLLAALALSLFSTAAFAQHRAQPVPPSGTAYGVTYGNGYGRGGVDRDGDGDVDRRDRRGHYETRTSQQWVPGQVTQVWVAGFCHRPPFSPIQVCTQGRYETRQAPGYYQTVQHQVWVADRDFGHGNRWGRQGRR